MKRCLVTYLDSAPTTQVNLAGPDHGLGPARVFNKHDKDPNSRTCRTKKLMLEDEELRGLKRDHRFSVEPITKAAPKKRAAQKPTEE